LKYAARLPLFYDFSLGDLLASWALSHLACLLPHFPSRQQGQARSLWPRRFMLKQQRSRRRRWPAQPHLQKENTAHN
jgi:hypothetical protein